MTPKAGLGVKSVGEIDSRAQEIELILRQCVYQWDAGTMNDLHECFERAKKLLGTERR